MGIGTQKRALLQVSAGDIAAGNLKAGRLSRTYLLSVSAFLNNLYSMESQTRE